MSRVTASLFTALAIAAVVWASITLLAHQTQHRHRSLILAIRTQKPPVSLAEINTAIRDIQQTLRIAPCNLPLSKQLVLLLAYASDRHMASGALLEADDTLDGTHAALQKQLSCAPMDGKAWLDFALITTQREGFSDAAAKAYAMSARVAPGESWLAQKRLEFALSLRPLLDAASLSVARRDITVLQRAHPIRLNAILKQAGGLKAPTELEMLLQ